MADAATPRMRSDDEHDRRLLGHVHPPDWVNPKPAGRYHLVVVGAGTAGLVSAIIAAGAGAKVALVERHLMGGDCLNAGCVPSKGMIAGARAWHAARTAGRTFGAPAVAGDGDFAYAMARMRRLRADLAEVDGAARFRDLGVDVFLGEGRFIASDAVEVGGRRLCFRRAVVATGGRAATPPIPGLDQVDYLTNDNVFSLRALPPRLGVIGAGPIGCELAQAFARYGSAVHLFDRGRRVLRREDADAAAIVQRALAADGVALYLGAEIAAVERRADGGPAVVYRAAGEQAVQEVDQLLVATGRTPNVDGLGLSAAGVDFDPRRGVAVDDRLRTSNRRIFACGDVASRLRLTHAADAQARIVVQNALFFRRLRASRLVIPWTTYTSPEIAHVGLDRAAAEARGQAVESFTVALDEVDRAVLDGEDQGFVRVHLKPGSDRILGATLVAHHAGDMIGALCLATTHGIGLGRFASTVFPYPTQGEALRKVADAYLRTKLTPTAKSVLATWLRIFS